MKSAYLLQVFCIFSLKDLTSHALPRIIAHNSSNEPLQKLGLHHHHESTPSSISLATEAGILAGIWNKVSHVFSRQAPSPDNVFDLDEEGNRKFHVAKLRESPNYARLKTLDVYRMNNDNKHKRSDGSDHSFSETTDNDVTESAEEISTTDNDDDISLNESTDSNDSQLRQKRQGVSNIAKILERAILASFETATDEISPSLHDHHHSTSSSHDISQQILNELVTDILKVKEKADKRDKEMVAENRELNKSTNITKVNEAGKVYEEDTKNSREKSSEHKMRHDHDDHDDHTTPMSISKTLREENITVNVTESPNSESTQVLVTSQETNMAKLLSALSSKDRFKLLTPLEYAFGRGSLKMGVENSDLKIAFNLPFNESTTERSIRIERGRLNQRKSDDHTHTEDTERVDEIPSGVVTLAEEQISTE